MAIFDKYRVILSGRVLPEHDRQDVLMALARLFNSTSRRMESLLKGKEVVMKKEYSEDEAVKICSAIREAGVACKIEKIEEVELAIVDDGFLPESASTKKSKPAKKTKIDSQLTSHVCPNCNKKLSVHLSVCKFCGFTVANPFDSLNSGQGDLYDPEMDDYQEEAAPKSAQQIGLMHFVQENADFYREKFAKFGSLRKPKFAPTWNWPAFFIFFLWAMYRKLWLWAGINFLGSFVILFATPPFLIQLAWLLGWPLAANYLYYRHCLKHVATDGSANLAKGGVSRIGVWVGIGILFAASMLFANSMVAKLNSIYVQQSETSIIERGDGSAVVDLEQMNDTEKRTLTMMGVLSASITLFAEKVKGDKSNMDIYLQQIAKKDIADAWKTKMKVSFSNNRILLQSAGPDKLFDNADDILHSTDLQLSNF